MVTRSAINRSWLIAVAAAGALPFAAQAQTNPSPLIPQNRADQNPAAIRERQGTGPRTPNAVAPTAAIAPFVLRSVVIEGSTLPAAELAAAWRPFVGHTVDAAGLAKVTDALAELYERHDIAIYTLAIQKQTFSDGVVRVRALEGHVEGFDIQGPAGRTQRALIERYMARMTAETPLHRSTLQRYVSLIRDIPGLESRMDLQNGVSDDGVRMRLTLRPHPVQVALAVNTRGTAYLGRTQVQGDLYLNSLLRQGDQTRLTVATPTDARLFQSYGLQHQQPIGDSGLTATATLGYLRTRPKDTDLVGHATAAGVQLSYPFLRSYNRNAYGTVSLDGVDNDNAFLGFTFASDRTRAVRGALSYSEQTDRRLIVVTGTLSRGIDGLGARTADPNLSKLEFTKFNSKIVANFAIGRHAALRLSAAGQGSGDRLPATEQFSLGGDEFGRAYEASVIAGDYGYAGSAEIAYRPERLPRRLLGSEGFAFIDGGEVWYKGRLGAPTASAKLASVGFSVRAQVTNHAIIQAEAAHALENPLPFRDEGGWRGVVSIKTLF